MRELQHVRTMQKTRHPWGLMPGFVLYWVSDSHVDLSTDRGDRIQRFVDLVNQDLPDLVIHTGDFVEGQRTKGDENDDQTAFSTMWASITVPCRELLGNRDLESYTHHDWSVSLGRTNTPTLLGSPFNGDFTMTSASGVTVRFMMFSWDVPKTTGQEYIETALETETSADALVIFTHDGSTWYKPVNTAISKVRSANPDLPVYHLFGHHHPFLRAVGEEKAVLKNSHGIEYPDPLVRGFLARGMMDWDDGHFARFDFGRYGGIRYKDMRV